MSNPKKVAFIPMTMSLGFMFVAMKGLVRGIDNHEPWRIAAASGGFAVFLFFCGNDGFADC
jgi:hypothetical protein